MFDSITDLSICIIVINIVSVVTYYSLNKRINDIKRNNELTMKTLENLLVILSDDIKISRNTYKNM